MSATTTAASARKHSFQWKTLGPDTFPSVVSSEDGCRYAKDDDYLNAVLDSWKEDTCGGISPQGVETSPLVYHDDDETPLYGHVVRPTTTDTTASDSRPLRPGILLFHTAAGPQDVFLFQKAANLASSELGCVVLICDVVSDREGWSWTPHGDRTPFNEAKDALLRDNARLMRSRVKAAIEALVGGPRDGDDDGGVGGLGVDPMRLGSLGWCFGAHPILELASLQHKQDTETAEAETGEDSVGVAFSAPALVSYHGVYRRDDPSTHLPSGDASVSGIKNKVVTREVLVCTGKSDPFVAPDDVEFAKKAMEGYSYSVQIMEFDGAKHGFTNPAQDFNSNPAFQYNDYAAKESWDATLNLLKSKLAP
eukprot:CAMPEP_0201118856 /NCGR_PEP_ID=MMETSP0850-20130426/3046_1 /ASSEMBLY_ACC=CAM_ASM_000622 /TAXON_ID=183588 /ORGANISM="Pseudo-nitzschia fraudulenta, Strain WWA7" /LENGTH=364 /DNA_ID=CAMNT_0047384317 /DNA_START=175 /DNA_END=1269 /DNA_ORIENTATION=+